MKFNVVPTRSDTISVSGSFYDCPSKNAFTLQRVNGNLQWVQYKTKPRNRKAEVWLGGDYGLIHISHPDDLFSFNKEQIKELNELDLIERRAKKWENKHKAGRKVHDLLFSLRSQMRNFISSEIKKMGVSGECLISSDFASYPVRKSVWPGDWSTPKNDTSPYIEQTRFGVAFFEFNNKEEGVSYIEEWVDYTRREDWFPRVVVW